MASGCGARWTGADTHASSRLSDKATAVGWILYTPPQCARGTASRRERPAAHGLGVRERTVQGDRTVHMGAGRCRQNVSIVSILFLFVPSFPEHASSSRVLLVGLDSLGSGFLLQGTHTHGTRLAARRTEAAGRCESSGQRWQRRGEGEGETKQNTGDKTTGEPAIRRQDVANVDLLSTGLTVQESK